MNAIKLLKIKKEKNRISYLFITEGEIGKAIRDDKEFFLEYDFEVENIPDSILVIPFLGNIMPIAWVYDARVEIQEIDKDYLESLDEVKRSYSYMFPKLDFKGEIRTNNIVKNCAKQSGKKLLFFSGGVDATSSLIDILESKPMLCTLWGSDIYLKDIEGWNVVNRNVIRAGKEYNLDTTFIKTSFRDILNYEILNNRFAKPNHENWWHGFQHGMAILTHAAPISFAYGLDEVNIAATASVKSKEDYLCASTPIIDNNVKFCGCRCVHEGYENSRNDKVRKICTYSKKNNMNINLRVCWETRTGYNCCVCEKCARTYMAIWSEGFDPKEFGFNITNEILQKVVDKIKQGELNLPIIFWEDIIRQCSVNTKLLNENILARYLVDNVKQYNGLQYVYHKTKVKELEENNVRAIMLESKKDYSSSKSSFESVGGNTGNMLFRESIIKNLHALPMSCAEYRRVNEDFKNIPIVTTDFIWINENSNFDWMYKRVEEFKDTIFVPMSVGLQSPNMNTNFKLPSSAKNALSAIQERAVIGVRGEYTAEILNKNGIKNIEVIGCPSLFYQGTPDVQIRKKSAEIKHVSVNFRTFYGSLTVKEKRFLTYCANRGYNFIEQTAYEFSEQNAKDKKYYNYISKWLTQKKKIFFDVNDWKLDMSKQQFSMGLRFHGNVVALWNGIPALFFAIDSRTEELASYFSLPYMKMEEFDDTRPIQYYYDLANYDNFNKNYSKLYNRYESFLKKNNLK